MRYAGGLVLLAAGVASGVAGVALLERTWTLAWLAVAVLALLVWVGPGWLTRLPFALGFAAAVGAGSWTRPEGDYLVASSWRGYALLVLGLVVLVGSLVTLPRPHRDREVHLS